MSEIRIIDSPMVNWLKTFVGEIPFEILNFPESSPYEQFPSQEIGNIQVPKLNDLTAKEAVIFEKLESANADRLRDVRLKTRSLGKKIKDTFNLEKSGDGIRYIFPDADFQQSEEYKAIADSETFEEFFAVHESEIFELVELYKLLGDDKVLNWVKAIFLLASRLGVHWLTQGDCLLRGQIEDINKFIALETNRGIELEPIEPTDEEVPETGKATPVTGKRTTGK